MQLDSPKVQKSMQELRHKYCKTTFHKITEHNGFKCTFKRGILSFACTTLDHSLTLEKTHIIHLLNTCFRHFALAPARGKISNCLTFNFGFVLLGSHLSVTSYARGLREGPKDGRSGSKIYGGQESKGLNTRRHCTGLYSLWWQFCEYLEDQRIVYFS